MRKLWELGYLGDRLSIFVGREGFKKPAMVGSDVLVDADIGIQHCRNGDDETHGLDVSQPLLVRENCGVFRHGLSRSRPQVNEADGFNSLGPNFIKGSDAFRL